jgi:DNA-binding transcriptional LysR family regulator
VQELYRDRFLAISKPAYFAEWKNRWEKLPVRRPLRGTDLERFPLILPESGSAERRFLEECYQRAVGRLPDAVVEVVGWEVILRFGMAGVGVGIITEQALKNHLVDLSTTEQKKIPKHTHRLDDDDFPSESVNLVARRLHGQGEPDLRPHASELLRLIEAQGKSPSKPAMSLK